MSKKGYEREARRSAWRNAQGLGEDNRGGKGLCKFVQILIMHDILKILKLHPARRAPPSGGAADRFAHSAGPGKKQWPQKQPRDDEFNRESNPKKQQENTKRKLKKHQRSGTPFSRNVSPQGSPKESPNHEEITKIKPEA